MTTSIQLQADNIHKRFGSNEVLKGVSVTAHKGDVIAMIGSSGSGVSCRIWRSLYERPYTTKPCLVRSRFARSYLMTRYSSLITSRSA